MLMIDGKLPRPTQQQYSATEPKIQKSKRTTTEEPETTTEKQPEAVPQKIEGDCREESESKVAK
jgi:hypothetical protein